MMELNKHRAVILLMMLYAQFCKMQLLAAHLYTVLCCASYFVSLKCRPSFPCGLSG